MAGLALPKRIDNWSLTSLQQRMVKTGEQLVTHARYYVFFLLEGHLHCADAGPDRATAGTDGIDRCARTLIFASNCGRGLGLPVLYRASLPLDAHLK